MQREVFPLIFEAFAFAIVSFPMREIYVYGTAEFFCYVALLSFSTDPSTVEQFPCGELSLAGGRLGRF